MWTIDEGSMEAGALRDGLAVSEVGEYPAWYADADAAQMAQDDGRSSVHDSGVWGDNTAPYGASELATAHSTATALIGWRMRGKAQQISARAQEARARVDFRVNSAWHAIDQWKAARLNFLGQEFERFVVMNLGRPPSHTIVSLAVFYVILFVGELILLSTAMQALGISDQLLFAPLPLTELHLAALTAVVALTALAHSAGGLAQHYMYAHERRRRMPDAAARAALPAASRASVGIGGAMLVGSMVVTSGILWLRLDYVAATAQATAPAVHPAAFALLQLGLLAGALWAGYHFTDPSAAAYTASLDELRQTEDVLQASLAAAEATALQASAAVEEINTAVAQAGHHVHADAANANRQLGGVWPRHVILSQPEPVTEPLFGTGLPTVEVAPPADLLRELTGLTPLPAVEPTDISALHAHHRAAIHEVEQYRVNLRAHGPYGRLAALAPSGAGNPEDVRPAPVNTTVQPADSLVELAGNGTPQGTVR